MAKLCVIAIALAACGGGTAADLSVEQDGPYQVGATRIDLTDASRGRTLTTELWYPTDAIAADVPVEMLEIDPHRASYAGLLAAAPADCPTRTAHVAIDAPAKAGPFPLIAFSHCHDCVRFSELTVAQRLASHGFVVVAVDHTTNTIYDHLAGTDVPISSAFLQTRALDVRFAIDQVLAGATPVPAASIDATEIGVFGHSYGGVTAGEVAQDDTRVKAALSIASPMDNPLIEGVHIANLHVPLGFLVAVEDNSITEIGNDLIRKQNFAMATTPAWKWEVADAGHWSFSDVDGAADLFMAGCGAATRQTDGTDFTYLDPPTGRAIAAAYTTAFFEATLEGSAGARAYLDGAHGPGVSAEHRN